MHARNKSINKAFPSLLILACIILTRTCHGTLYYNYPTEYDGAPSGSIQKLNAANERFIVASGLNNPSGIAFDNEGNLYFGNVISNHNQFEIYQMTPDNTITRRKTIQFPNRISFSEWAFDIAVGPSGDIYYNYPTEYDGAPSGSIQRLNASNERYMVASGLNNPSGIAFDNEGNLYFGNVISNPHQFEIYKMTPDHTITRLQVIQLPDRISLGKWAFDIAVPEPGTLLMSGCGAFILFRNRRRG